jgi:hypothetical protein
MPTRTLCLLLCASILGLSSLSAAEPEAYTAPDGKFSINFPNAPKVTEKKWSGKPAKIYGARIGAVAGIVMVVDDPDLRTATLEAVDKQLNTARDAYAMKGKILSETKVKFLDRHPGRDVLVQKNDSEQFAHVRIYVIDSTLYVISAQGTGKEAVTSKESNAFLDSFQLGKK